MEPDSGGQRNDEVLRKIAITIQESVLGGDSVYINNPFDDLLKKAPEGRGRTKAQWKPPSSAHLTLDTCPYLPGDQMSNDIKRDFVISGKAKFEKNKYFWGVCNDFSWVCTSILTAKKVKGQGALLPPNCRVEWYGWKGISSFDHLFTVVNRAEGSANGNWSTWGYDCFVVDQWYALQTCTHPVKTLNNQASEFYDKLFLEWWEEMQKVSQPVSFRDGSRGMARLQLLPFAEFTSQSYP
jgi:hypothetical protein